MAKRKARSEQRREARGGRISARDTMELASELVGSHGRGEGIIINIILPEAAAFGQRTAAAHRAGFKERVPPGRHDYGKISD